MTKKKIEHQTQSSIQRYELISFYKTLRVKVMLLLSAIYDKS